MKALVCLCLLALAACATRHEWGGAEQVVQTGRGSYMVTASAHCSGTPRKTLIRRKEYLVDVKCDAEPTETAVVAANTFCKTSGFVATITHIDRQTELDIRHPSIDLKNVQGRVDPEQLQSLARIQFKCSDVTHQETSVLVSEPSKEVVIRER